MNNLERSARYIAFLCNRFRTTKNIHCLDGYNEESTRIEDYQCVCTLLDILDDRGKIFDCGCGTGSLLKFVVDRYPGLIPYGIDANPEALKVLKSEILPGFADNFHLRNWFLDEIEIVADVCILMAGLVTMENLRISSKYLIVRDYAADRSVNYSPSHIALRELLYSGLNSSFELIEISSCQSFHNWTLYEVQPYSMTSPLEAH